VSNGGIINNTSVFGVSFWGYGASSNFPRHDKSKLFHRVIIVFLPTDCSSKSRESLHAALMALVQVVIVPAAAKGRLPVDPTKVTIITHLVTVERPRAELHLTLLLVEWEILDVDRARTLVDGRWDP
jgi:hypothetical protein